MARTSVRNRSLDGVRGLAILLVVAGHISPEHVRYGGLVGVTLFFVLSGHLITTVLLKEVEQQGRLDWGAFYARRALRLLPALFVVLAATPVIMWAVGDPRLEQYPRWGAAVFFYVGNFVRASGGSLGPLDHTWSLSVEEQFYIVWPVVLLLLVRSRWRTGPAVLWLAVAAVGWRLVAAALFEFPRVYFALDTNVFALLIGAALATSSPSGPRTGHAVRAGWAAKASLLGLIVLSCLPSIDLYGVDLDLIEWGAPLGALVAVALVASARHLDTGLLTHPVMTWFGTVSYGWYLWHRVLMTVRIDGERADTGLLVGAAVISLGVAWLSWNLVEEPAMRLKRRFERTSGRVDIG